MITLCCTQKLLRRLRIAWPEPASAAPTNVLGNWYANLIHVGRVQMVMATSERTLPTVLLPAVDLRKSLVPNLCEAVYLLLQRLGVDPARAAIEVDAMHDVRIGRTASRSVLGFMNDLSRMLDWGVREGRPPMEIMLRLAHTPMTGVVVKEGSHGFPDDAARSLLGVVKINRDGTL
ncbi:MAG: hypothetical protein ABI728_09010 [Betaproteobacteria bacterium]